MRWTDDFIRERLPSDPVAAGKYICEWILEGYTGDEYFEEILDDFAFLQAWVVHHKWVIAIPRIDTRNYGETIETITSWARDLKDEFDLMCAENAFSSSLQFYETQLGVTFAYQLTDGDIKRIQQLISQLRNEIAGSSLLEEGHRHRLLKRLEKLQAELHKRMSDYDRAYGILVDGIVLTHKFGQAVEPITRLIREITNLFWRAQSTCEELPGDSMLPLPPVPSIETDKEPQKSN